MTTHQGFPGLGILSTGDWLCTYRESNAHDVVTGVNRGIIYGKISSDDGATWGSAFVVADESVSEHDARDSTVLVLANGDVLVPYFTSDGSSGEIPLISKSTDDGATWTDGITITNTFTDWAAASGCGVQLANGDVLVPYYGEDTSDSFASVRVSKSTDDGATWTALAQIASGPTDSRSYEEPSLILLGNGNVVCYLRTSDNLFYASTSTDSGATWSAPASIGIAGTARPTVFRRASDGLLVLILRASLSSTEAFIVYSEDDGASWSTRGAFDLGLNHLFTYCQMIEVAAGAIAVAYSWDDSVSASGANGTLLLDHITRDGVIRP